MHRSTNVLSIRGTHLLLNGEPFPCQGLSFFSAIYSPALNASAERWVATGRHRFQRVVGKYCDHEIVVIIASVGKAGEVEPEKYVCGGTCGFAMMELRECPQCKLQRARTAKGLERRAFLREVDEFVKDKWDATGDLSNDG